jgi:DNA-binding GntR family transcriptional regulator
MVDTIRSAILRGMLHPGEHLSQNRLAEQHSVSKVPVREALNRLSAEGLVQHDRNRGYFVARPSRSEARQLYRLRRWLESELLRTARWPDEKELANLRKLRDVVLSPVGENKREEWMAAVAEMRFLIFDLSSEKTLLREARRLWMLTDRFRALLPADKSLSGERVLIDALAARDRELLLKAYGEDRQRIEGLLEDALDSLPGLWTED